MSEATETPDSPDGVALEATPEPLAILSDEDLVLRWRGSVTTSSLKRWRGTGEGPRFIRIGRTPLYRLEDVEAYELDRRQTS